MISKVTVYHNEESALVLEFPELDVVDISDHEVQKYIIKYGGAVGLPGGPLIFTQRVELIAGKEEAQDV